MSERSPLAPKGGKKALDRQFLVSFDSEASAARRAELFAKHHAKEIERVGSTQLYLIELPETADRDAVRKDLSASPGVRFVEPNLQMRTFKTTTPSKDE